MVKRKYIKHQIIPKKARRNDGGGGGKYIYSHKDLSVTLMYSFCKCSEGPKFSITII